MSGPQWLRDMATIKMRVSTDWHDDWEAYKKARERRRNKRCLLFVCDSKEMKDGLCCKHYKIKQAFGNPLAKVPKDHVLAMDIKQRNEAIVALYDKGGITMRELGKRYMLSPDRIHQIVAKAHRLANALEKERCRT